MRRIVVGLGVGFVLAVHAVALPVLGADAVTFGTPTAESSFGKQIAFHQPVTLASAPQRVEILLETPGAIGPDVVALPPGTPAGARTLDYSVDLASGHIVPNTTFTARWRIVGAEGAAWLGPEVRRTYADDRVTWRIVEGKVVRVHWYEGDQAFGQRALKIGDDAVAETARLLGVTETEPLDFFIYADVDKFYDALGPATRENVGGQAHPDIRTLFALITPAEIGANWVNVVVPHELVHVVFATAVDNPYHEPPRWLNEGLAVYLSEGLTSSYRSLVEGAARNGSIMPLDGLTGAFPTAGDRFLLAYGESVSAVDRIVRVNGRDALVRLITTYHRGVSDDEAFQAAIGQNVAGFQAAWLAELGTSPPERLGPRPAPAGPLPAGWGGPPAAPAGTNGSLGPLIAVIAVIGVFAAILVGLRRRTKLTPAPSAWPPSSRVAPPDSSPIQRPGSGPVQRPGSGPVQPPDPGQS